MANTRDSIGDQATLDGLVNRTLTSLEENGVTTLGWGALSKNTALTSVSFPAVTDIGNSAFQGCTELLSVSFPMATTVGMYCFDGCTKLSAVSLPAVTSFGSYAFMNCKALSGFDITNDISNIQASTFAGCSAFTWLKLRSTSKRTLNNTSAFANTPIGIGLGAIYVPSNLVSTYKADNNWKNFIIASLDDYPLTDFSTITDSWSEILAAEANGTYTSKYAVGDTKKATINGNTVYMQIAAFDADALTAGGTAKITWVAKHIAETHKMNETSANADGWAASGMRTWLQSTVYDGLDSTLKSAIKAVDKTHYDKTSNSTKTVSDTLWIPSWREAGFDTSNASCENSGPIYSGLFTGTTSRIKCNTTTISAASWWLRSASSSNAANFMYVSTSGGSTSNGGGSTTANGVVFGFCT